MSTTLEPRFRTQATQPVEDDSAESSESVIDRHSHFNGLYRTARDLRIEGSVEGEIECDGTVIVAQEARVAAKVRARNVIIAGSANGEITCQEQFTIQPTGEMRGQVQAASLVVEEGAFFEGEFRMAPNNEQSAKTDTIDWLRSDTFGSSSSDDTILGATDFRLTHDFEDEERVAEKSSDEEDDKDAVS